MFRVTVWNLIKLIWSYGAMYMDWKITRTFLRSEMISYRDSSRESTTYFSLNLMFKREVISLMQSAECGF